MEKPILSALLSVKSFELSDTEKYLFEKFNPAGIILLNRNMSSVQQVSDLIKSIKETIGRNNVIIALDAEGGRVNPLSLINFPKYASQNILGQADDINLTKLHATLIANNMHHIGANLTFAPVLDINYPDITIALKNRCFSNDKEKVVKHGKVLCNTYINNGICPCIKHIPGHGKAINDPHAELPIIDCSLNELVNDFYPFQQLNHMPMAMSAHIMLSQIDNQYPITLSKKGINEIIRSIIGFKGLLISDAIDMHALKGTIAERASLAWNAGCDMVCYCCAHEDELISLCENGKYMNDVIFERFEKIKQIVKHKKDIIILDNELKSYYSAISNFTEEQINYNAEVVLQNIKKGEN